MTHFFLENKYKLYIYIYIYILRVTLTQNMDWGFLLSTTFPKILMSSGSKKGTQICYPFPSKSPSKRIPSRFPNGATKERNSRLEGIFTSQYISLSIFPSESPVREPPPCSLTGSPREAILSHQSQWSTFQSFVHSFMSAGVPKFHRL